MTAPIAPRVSVILTTLNSERHLAEAIASCLGQTLTDLELIVVDGGSTDRTLAILAGVDDPRLRLVHQQGNDGRLPGAINLGVSQAQGAYLTWTQDDCFFETDAVEAMLAELERRPEVGLVYADYWDVDEQGNRLRYQRVNPPEVLTDRLGDDVIRQCFLLRREVWEAVGPQDPRHFPVHEVPWRLELARRFAIQPLHRPLQRYMVHQHSLTGRIGPWPLQRLMVRALHDSGHMSRADQRARLAKVDLDEAYEALVRHGQFGAFRRLALRAVMRKPSLAANRGLWRMLTLSVSPGRKARQVELAEAWRRRDEAEQARVALRDPGPEGA